MNDLPITPKPIPKDRQRPPFQQTIRLNASPEAVYRALTDAAEISRWFAPHVESDPRPGGKLVWDWTDHHRWENTVAAAEEGQLLRLNYVSWGPDGPGRAPLTIEFKLVGEGGGTNLKITHSGFGTDSSFDAEYDGISTGWPEELQSLKEYVDHHLGQERHLLWEVHRLPGIAKQDLDAAWQALLAPGCVGLQRLGGQGVLAAGEPIAIQPAGSAEASGRLVCVMGTTLAAVLTGQTGVPEDRIYMRLSVHAHGDEGSAWIWMTGWGDPGARALDRFRDPMARVSAQMRQLQGGGA